MKKRRRGVSAGTIVMLTLTAAVLAGFLALMPSFTGHQDIRLDAAKLAVAMDESLSQLAARSGDLMRSQPQSTILPPESLATARPQSITSTPAPVVTPVPKPSFTLCAAGSIEWNNTVRNALTIDDAYRFDILTDHFTGAMNADLSFAVLNHTLAQSEKLDNRNMPSDILAPLQAAGVNALSIGHPDILSHGTDGLEQTAKAIYQTGIMPVGAGGGISLLPNGCSVMLLHYQDEFSSASRKQSTEEERMQTFAPIDMERIRADIAAARENGAQVVIVSLHWGKEGAKQPTDEQIELAQQMADAGADIILGAGSGVLQPVKLLSASRGDGKYHPVLCAYSLGSLFSHERETRFTLASLLLKTEVIYDPVTGCVAFENLAYTPTYAWRGKQDGRTLYRILINDPENIPDFVDDNQRSTMERSYTLVNEVMADSGIEMQ